MARRRAIVIGNVSGAVGDRIDAMQKMVSGETKVDAVTGDWLSEINMAWRAAEYQKDPSKGFEGGFLDSLKLCNQELLKPGGVKMAVNAGALNPRALAEATSEYLKSVNSEMVVAWIEGDDVREQILKGQTKIFKHLTRPGETFEVDVSAQCALAYTGGWAITEALKNGADIVIAGRCTDASPVIALAAWWHGWGLTDWSHLAGALIAGHLIECGPYVVSNRKAHGWKQTVSLTNLYTGGNYPGFKSYLSTYLELGHPIACIEHDGSCTITKQPRTTGLISVDTVKNQLVYEIQGRYYYNTDVTADMENIKMSSNVANQVCVSGVIGLPPSPTTKLAVYRAGGFQSETTIYLFGLDAIQKAQSWEAMVRSKLDLKKFQVLDFQLLGVCAADPKTQNEATTVLRIFAQAEDELTLGILDFYSNIMSNGMQAFPAFTPTLNTAAAIPKPFSQYFSGIYPTDQLMMKAHLSSGKTFNAAKPEHFSKMSAIAQPSSETAEPCNLDSFGPTVVVPLGKAVYARSGDKGSNINIGLYFPQLPESGIDIDDEDMQEEKWKWLQTFMTVSKLVELIGRRTEGTKELRIERFEFKFLRAVNFVIFDVLDEGASSTRYVDVLGKGFAEYIRARLVSMPRKFLDQGGEKRVITKVLFWLVDKNEAVAPPASGNKTIIVL